MHRFVHSAATINHRHGCSRSSRVDRNERGMNPSTDDAKTNDALGMFLLSLKTTTTSRNGFLPTTVLCPPLPNITSMAILSVYAEVLPLHTTPYYIGQQQVKQWVVLKRKEQNDHCDQAACRHVVRRRLQGMTNGTVNPMQSRQQARSIGLLSVSLAFS